MHRTDPAEVAAATLYFPPQVKRIQEPRFCFDPAERERALQTYRELGADTLFELVVDQEGKVVKARVLRTDERRSYREDMLDHARRFRFTPDREVPGYRAFYYPARYGFDNEFEWL